MIFSVRMIAYHTLNNGEALIRPVKVPDSELRKNLAGNLELIFKYGQNDIQPVQNRCSVSVTDVIEYCNKLYVVCSIGFKEISFTEYDRYIQMKKAKLVPDVIVSGDIR